MLVRLALSFCFFLVGYLLRLIFKGLTPKKLFFMKECHFEQAFAKFGIYPLYLKKLGKIKMAAVTIATGN